MINTVKVAQQTINAIHGQLGDPIEWDEGHKSEGAVLGQIVEPNNSGGESFTPKQFIFWAEIIKANEKLEWNITSIKIVGPGSATRLTW